MYIFNSAGDVVINSENVKVFHIKPYEPEGYYGLFCDETEICCFITENEAKRELEKIVDCIIENALTYKI